jgi:ferric-dicitrate binding protein FerR (iron transport regulator)
MTENLRPDRDEMSDAILERTLSDALRTLPLVEDACERLREAVAREWRATTKASRDAPSPSRRVRWVALAAAVGVVAVTAMFLAIRPATAPAVVGVLSRLDNGSIDVRRAVLRHRALQAGDSLRSGDTLTAHGPALVALAGGGTLRIAPDTVIEVTSATRIELQRGMLYVDVPPGATTSGHVSVMTRVGLIEHVGTEFEVVSTDQTVRIRVREGLIRLLGSVGAVTAPAGTELLARAGGRLARRSVATYGRDWMWTAALAPDYEIEGRPLADFLKWVSRELGRQADFADAHVRGIADRTILHGSVRGREPVEALAIVLATTSLTYEIWDDAIRVHARP